MSDSSMLDKVAGQEDRLQVGQLDATAFDSGRLKITVAIECFMVSFEWLYREVSSRL